MKRSGDLESDHHLVVAEIKVKPVALEKPRTTRIEYCMPTLKDTGVKDEFAIVLSNQYNAVCNRADNEEEMHTSTYDDVVR